MVIQENSKFERDSYGVGRVHTIGRYVKDYAVRCKEAKQQEALVTGNCF